MIRIWTLLLLARLSSSSLAQPYLEKKHRRVLTSVFLQNSHEAFFGLIRACASSYEGKKGKSKKSEKLGYAFRKGLIILAL